MTDQQPRESRTAEEVLALIQVDEDNGLDVFEVLQRYRNDGSCEHIIRQRLNDLPAMARRVIIQVDLIEFHKADAANERAERDKLAAELVEYEKICVGYRQANDKLAAQVEEWKESHALTVRDMDSYLDGMTKAQQENDALWKALEEAKHLLKMGDSQVQYVTTRGEWEAWQLQVQKLLATQPEEGAK